MYGFIIVGAIIFILATSGCIGALRENTCMLKFFVYSLILIFLAEITLGVLAYFYQDAVFQILEKWLDKSIEEYYGTVFLWFLTSNYLFVLQKERR